jgi:hypothetical protein
VKSHSVHRANAARVVLGKKAHRGKGNKVAVPNPLASVLLAIGRHVRIVPPAIDRPAEMIGQELIVPLEAKAHHGAGKEIGHRVIGHRAIVRRGSGPVRHAVAATIGAAMNRNNRGSSNVRRRSPRSRSH